MGSNRSLHIVIDAPSGPCSELRFMHDHVRFAFSRLEIGDGPWKGRDRVHGLPSVYGFIQEVGEAKNLLMQGLVLSDLLP